MFPRTAFPGTSESSLISGSPLCSPATNCYLKRLQTTQLFGVKREENVTFLEKCSFLKFPGSSLLVFPSSLT